MRKEISIDIDGQAIKGILTNPGTEKVVIIAHAFGNGILPHTKESLLAKALADTGIAALEFTFRGTSPSDGKPEDMSVESEVRDCKAVIEFAKQNFTDIALLGQSLGGTIITKSYDVDIKLMLYWYAAFDLPNTLLATYLDENIDKEIAEKGKVTVWNVTIGKQFVQDVKSTKVYDNLPRVPSLFIHGEQDSVVPVEQAKTAYNKINAEKQLHIIEGADHVLTHHRQEAIDKTINFLKKYL